MSAEATAADDGSELKNEIVTDFTRFHGRLEDRLKTLRNCVEVAEGDYEMAAEYSPYDDGTDRVSVTIDSDDWIGNEGEIGDMHFHIILGPRGGLKHVTSRRDLVSGKRDILAVNDTKKRAWDELMRSIKRAK